MNGDNLAQISHQIVAISILKPASAQLSAGRLILGSQHMAFSKLLLIWLADTSGGCCQATVLWPPLLASVTLLLSPL